jgi:hypothetical protein
MVVPGPDGGLTGQTIAGVEMLGDEHEGTGSGSVPTVFPSIASLVILWPPSIVLDLISYINEAIWVSQVFEDVALVF